MASPVVHFEINGSDLEKMQGFYSSMFDWEIQAMPEMGYGMVAGADGGIGGGLASAPGMSSSVTVYVAVDDLQAHLDKAASLGGKVVQEVTEIPGAGVTVAMFADPDGNNIGLVKSGSGS